MDDALSEAPHAALRYPDFRYFQAARLTSVLSSEMVAVAVAWQVYSLTHRALSLGYVGLAQVIPSFVLFLIAGHAVDRFDRRRVLLAVQFSYAVIVALLLAYTLKGSAGVAPIYAIVVLQGTVRAFGAPAGQAFMSQLVPEQHFANAVTWGSSTFMVATIIGPGLGGIVYAWLGGAAWVYAVAVVTYLFSFFFTLAIRHRTGRMEPRAASLDTLLAGFRYVWSSQIILGSISLDLFAVLLGGAVALLPIFASDILHTGVRGLGMLRAAPSLGAMVMAILLAFRPLKRNAGRWMYICVAIFGAATIGFGLSRNLWLSLGLLVLVGASDMVSVVVRSTLVQIQTPVHMRGRVSSVNMLFIGGSNQLGEFESGATAQWLGAVRATVLGGVGTLIVVGLWWGWFPELRRVQTLRAPKTPAAPATHATQAPPAP
ncbi:MAG TPA: MFS transporter [Terriglobales bacterium]|nr:MFS transporter [Terriglobales bacterium]